MSSERRLPGWQVRPRTPRERALSLTAFLSRGREKAEPFERINIFSKQGTRKDFDACTSLHFLRLLQTSLAAAY